MSKTVLEGVDPKTEKRITVMPHLLRAIIDGDLVKVERMIDADPQLLELDDMYGMSAVRAAIEHNRYETFTFFLGWGISLDPVACQHQWRPLHHCIEKGDLEMMEFLLQHGANVEELDFYEDTPMHKAVYRDNLEAIRLLHRYGADINARCGVYERTPRREAECSGRQEAAALLASLGGTNVIKLR